MVNPDGQDATLEEGFTYIVTLVPDAELRRALRDERITPGADIPEDPTEPITAAHLATVITIFQGGLGDLTGLEYAINLTQLFSPNGGKNDLSPLAELTNLTNLLLDNNAISDVSPLAKVTSLTTLQLGVNQISDVSSLATLTNLSSLKLDGNQISDVSPLAELTNLTSLVLDNNAISDLSPLAALTNLGTLQLGSNQINDVSSLATLTNLGTLQLGSNQINDVSSLATLTNLTSLKLDDSQISDVGSLAALTELTRLELFDNQISDVNPLGTLTKLRFLDLSNNAISDLSPLAALTNLSSLKLDGNEISDVEALAGLTNPRTLNLNFNGIRDISPLVQNPGIGSRDVVALRGNPLSYRAINTDIPILLARGVNVTFVPRVPRTLTNLSGDGQIGDAGTNLASPLVVEVRDQNGATYEGVPVTFAVTLGEGALSTEEVTTDVDGLAQTTLTLGDSVGPYMVDVAAVGISTPSTFTAHIPVTVPDADLRTVLEAALQKNPSEPITTTELETLTGLFASNREISHLSGLEYAVNLTSVFLDDNTISDLSPLAALTKLTDVELGNNQINDLSPLADLTNLANLRLGNNQISDLNPLANLTNLTHLELPSNEISDLSPLATLTNLAHLELFSNQISDLSSLSVLTDLTDLRLSANQITDLEPLAGLRDLIDLRLSANQISDVSALANLVNLTSVWLDVNQIREIKSLISNTGLGSGDTLQIFANPLTYETIRGDIPQLEKRGVVLIFPPSTPTTLSKISGDNQTGEPNGRLTDAFVVKVEDQKGISFEGVPVTFKVTGGDSSLSVENVNTDANGLAETTLTLGANVDTHMVEATAAEIDIPQTFTATVQIPEEFLIEEIRPLGGPLEGGTEVTITGGVFDTKTEVTIGGLPLANLEVTATRITGTTPDSEEGPQDVIVIRGGQRRVVEGGFHYAHAPTISAIEPTRGTIGTEVTISGDNFMASLSDQTIKVMVGDNTADVSVQFESSEKLMFRAPIRPDGVSFDLKVINPEGQESQESIIFTYNPAPSITELLPSRGRVAGGTRVQIRGENFICEDIALEVNSKPVEPNDLDCSSSAEMSFITPAGSDAGTVDVVVTNADGQIAEGRFTYAAPPIVHSVSPVGGAPAGGSLITVLGENFLDTIDRKSVSVKIGGRDAQFVSRLSDTEIIATTPPAETPDQAVRLIVVGPEGQESSQDVRFTYNAELSISDISPRMGSPAGGAEVTISGTGFSEVGTQSFRVLFGDGEAEVVRLASSREVIIRTPTGNPGVIVDITIENADDQTETLRPGFEYTETLAARDILPRVGALEGGTQVIITGSGFMDEEIDGRKLTVTFGGKLGSIVSIKSTQLSLRTPPGAAETAVEVMITGPDGQQAPLPSPFHYLDFPADDVLVYNYPNPTLLGSGTTFRFRNGDGKVEIKIFNAGGELIISLTGGGGDTISWDGRNRFGDVAPVGLYPYVYMVDGDVKDGQLLHIHR